ncbi:MULTISPECIES: LysM peptidoglycan-binding domain-containing protein [Leeuwenhoekiella]|mgnify:FL=1|uniref:LysM peptidoglycan-binding domain-containing protein n=2 Tax=Flavobacteriaceae TaxID=49546 RepID=UPI000C58875E|nr:LysM peptidoglycan-binding domain-containing protein [Leeuwenhoekiella blandensis]MBQ52259.1 peptidoglycan-binding protein LysM [Leeuwenhoekiella sp.]|tara:strand:- start:1034 stop:3010 length:1977 start_codon:yes stop_codon:yes gene_type:complete
MKNITILFVFIFVVFSCSSIGQQQYASHQVREGETVSTIANKYNVTVYEIYRLNPEAKDKLYPGLVLILPGGKSAPGGSELSADGKFVLHTVAKGETLYKLSKKYDVSESEIKRYNKHLYSAELRNGEIVKIPNKNEVAADETAKPALTKRKHVVKPKETKYGLASMYGITIEELEQMNPEISDGLQIGDIINVPDKSYAKDAVLEESKYGFYEVKPKENFYRLTERWNMTEEELVALNPALVDGLKSGMILKLPKEKLTGASAVTVEGQAVKLADNLVNRSTKNIAVMLPFNLRKTVVDTGDVRKQVLKNDRVMNIALDFYSGVLMAVDSAKALGISTKLVAFDTEYSRADGKAGNDRKVEDIIRSNDFSNMNAVIGPLLTSNVEKASQLLRERAIPVVSPIVPNVAMRSNMFQSRPDDEILKQQMMQFIKLEGKGKNIVIVADSKHLKERNELTALYPDARIVYPESSDNGSYLKASDLTDKLSETIENWVILESNDVALISNTTTNLSTQLADKKITLLTTDKGSAYESDDVSNITLMKLNFHFPSVDRSYNEKHASFVEAYSNKYGYVPNSYAVRGYDITFDTILRLAASESLYDAADAGYLTQYVENKFNYVQDPVSTGYFNTAAYILKYGENLEEIVVELPVESSESSYLKN